MWCSSAHRNALRHPLSAAGERNILRTPAVQQQLLAFLPNLRAFAISLCQDRARADDLVQDTILSAWQHWDRFQEGTNLRAWLFTILRNRFLTEIRKRRDEVSLGEEEALPLSLTVEPAQMSWMDSRDLLEALTHLPLDQREAIILVGAEGFGYEEAAEMCGCPVGTIQSRVHRARIRLLQLLGNDAPGGPVSELSRHKALHAA